MRYFLQAVDTENLPFEQEVSGPDHYEKLKRQLRREGYSDFALDERWSDLDEMYEYLNATNGNELEADAELVEPN